MATRMQQRRGTAAQWTSANPILNAGEMGWESDTNKFKIGDGTNHWADLDYFIDQSSTVNPAFGSSITFEGATANAFETTLQVADPTADRTITLPDSTGTVVVADGSGNVTVSGNLTVNGTTTTVNSTEINVTTGLVFEGATANGYETTISVVDPTADRTITFKDESGTVAFTADIVSSGTLLQNNIDLKQNIVTGVSDTEIGYLDGVTSAIQTQLNNKQDKVASVNDTEIGYLDGVTSSIQNQLDAKRATADDVILAATKVVVFEGTTDDAYETTLTVTDPTADRTITLPNASGTVVLADSSQTLTNKTITSADNTVTITASAVSDFTEAAQDAVGNSVGTGLSYNDSTGAVSVDTTTIQARVTNVSDTEIGYLDGVTSSIQTQLDAKVAKSALASGIETFLGTPTSANLAAALTDESGSNKIVFNSSPGIASPSISGTLRLIAGTNIEFEGATDDAYETTLTVTDPTADRTITIPDVTGTVVTTGDTGTVTSTMIADGTIVNADINASAAIALSKLATDPLARANHTGTQTASTISDFDTQVRTSKVTDLTAPTSSFSMNSQKITSLADPTADQDAATKAYVDAATAGLNVHASVKAATTANITLASAVENGDTLDGVTLATGDRILIKNQTTKADNGVYVVAASGAPARAADYNTTPEVDAGDFIFVESGTVNGKTGWIQTNTIATIGTSDIEFTQFSGAGTYAAGTGLTLTGNTFSINTETTVDLNTAQTLTNKTINGSNNTITNVSLTSGVTGTLPVANGGTGITSIGTGVATALGTNVGSAGAFVTNGGALGTPSSGTLTNATGLPVSTGISGLGTGVATFLATPSSANLAAALTDETGTGANVFANSPTLVTPTLGVATATSITFSDGTQSKEGVPSRTTIVQKTDSYTLSSLTERDNLIEMGKATAQTLTIPTNATVAYPVGTSIDILQTGAGQVTVAGASGVTVNATPGLKLRAQWSSATLLKRATDPWVVMGDLSA